MTPADLPAIVAAMRSPAGWDASPSEVLTVALMLADERDAAVARLAPARLPSLRRGRSFSPRIGETRVHIRVNPDAPEPPREVWIDVDHKEGAILVGIGHALARLISIALQAHTPPEEIVRALRGTTGWPGDVTDCDGVTHAESLPDLVAQVLAVAAGLP